MSDRIEGLDWWIADGKIHDPRTGAQHEVSCYEPELWQVALSLQSNLRHWKEVATEECDRADDLQAQLDEALKAMDSLQNEKAGLRQHRDQCQADSIRLTKERDEALVLLRNVLEDSSMHALHLETTEPIAQFLARIDNKEDNPQVVAKRPSTITFPPEKITEDVSYIMPDHIQGPLEFADKFNGLLMRVRALENAQRGVSG